MGACFVFGARSPVIEFVPPVVLLDVLSSPLDLSPSFRPKLEDFVHAWELRYGVPSCGDAALISSPLLGLQNAVGDLHGKGCSHYVECSLGACLLQNILRWVSPPFFKIVLTHRGALP